MKRIMMVTLVLVIPSLVVYFGWVSGGARGRDSSNWYYIKIKDNALQILKWGQVSDWEMKEAHSAAVSDYQTMINIRDQAMAEQVEKMITPTALVISALNNRVLHKIARQKGLIATVNELKNLIESIYPQNPQMALQYLMRGQRFDNEQAFVQSQIYRMTIDKAHFLFTSQAKASLFELWQDYQLREEKIDLPYVSFRGDDYIEKVEVSDDEIAQFFEEHKEDYRIPNQVKYEYFSITKNVLKDDAQTTEGELLAYYEKNLETEFKEEKQVKARLILLNLSPDSDEEQVKAAEKKADDIFTSLTVHQADFATLADIYTEDPNNITQEFDSEGKPTENKTKKGGLMDTFWSMKTAATSAYGKEVVEEALKLEPGKISSPIKSRRGFNIIRVEDTKPERTKPFSEVAEQAKDGVKREKSEIAFQNIKSLIYAKYENATTLSGLAKEVGLEVKETPLVNEDSMYVEGLGNISRHQSDLAQLKIGEMSDVIESPFMLAVASVKERVPSHIPDFEKTKTQAANDLKFKKAVELAKKDADEFLKDAASFDLMKETAEKKSFKLAEPEPFNHSNLPDDLMAIKNFAQITIKTKEGAIKMSDMFRQGKKGKDETTGYVVWHMKGKTPPDKEKFKEEIPDLLRNTIHEKQRTILLENLADLRKTLHYKVNPEFLKSER
ncbi:MAG TPA: peptidyl-prolyl cis-trans isomerase [Candidatus Sumerlaeota bacterium]|nr:peptidyl-prolyl cis-trans isomerase [Candidatus Sumerlaeota bacterium]